MRKKLFVILSALLILFTFSLAACKDVPQNGEYDIAAGVTGVRGDIEFTVVSYNLHSGGATQEMMDKAREQIDASGADIAGLQEVDRDGSGRAGDKMISTLTSGAMNNYFFAPTMSYFFGEDYGIMTTTRHEMAGSFSLFLPFPYEHLTLSNALIEPRVVTRTLITIDGVQVAAYNTISTTRARPCPTGPCLGARRCSSSMS